jgi:hypothetical protein
MPYSGILRRVVHTVFLRSALRFFVNANVPSSSFVTLMTEAIASSETSVPIRTTHRKIPEDIILNQENSAWV